MPKLKNHSKQVNDPVVEAIEQLEEKTVPVTYTITENTVTGEAKLNIEMPIDIPMEIYLAYTDANYDMAHNSNPCSVCRKRKEEGKTGIRVHFHGSETNKCPLAVAKDCLRGVSEEYHDKGDGMIENHPALLVDGHLHEEHILNSLLTAGMEVVMSAKREDRGEIQVWIERDTLNVNSGDPEPTQFRIIGHFDGLMERAGKVYLLECKAVKDYTYKKIKDEKRVSKVWYGQIQCYLMILDIETAIVIPKSRHSSDIVMPLEYKIDLDFIKERLGILADVHKRLTSPEKNLDGLKEHLDPDNSECKFCPYKRECWK